MSQNWQNIRLSFDLAKAALNQLDFLNEVNSLKHIFIGEIIDKAIYRYEKIWLPFYAKHCHNHKLYPPVDIAWIWHCHLLCPTDYAKDLNTICGQLLNHESLSVEERRYLSDYTQKIWERELNVSFDYLGKENNLIDINN